MGIADAFGPAPSAPAVNPLVVVKEWDLTDVTAADVSAAGAHAITTSGGAALLTITTGTEGTAPTAVTADFVNGQGLVVDLQSSADARDWVFYWPMPTSGIDQDKDFWMLEMIFTGVTLTSSDGSNLSTMSWGASTTTVVNGAPFWGMLLKNTAGNMYWTVRRKNGGSSTDGTATIDAGRISNGTIHVQIVGNRRGAYVIKDESAAFADPFPGSPTMQGGTGSASFNAFAGASTLWTGPYFICKNYLRYLEHRWQFTLTKVRLCKFSPYSS